MTINYSLRNNGLAQQPTVPIAPTCNMEAKQQYMGHNEQFLLMTMVTKTVCWSNDDFVGKKFIDTVKGAHASSTLYVKTSLDAGRWCLMASSGAKFELKPYHQNLLLLGNWRWWTQKAAKKKRQYTNLFCVISGRRIRPLAYKF
ncbi:unnamed protein product [Cylindrotheca closterium]|uniref:Uncharacterized protein n=1 Tax=Cylindrotheca closterium TaxID=2856 RepID=A0AAD2FG25_9STRA|nr:unnamed protein product [Cylindrotheca closterium]